MVKQIDLNVADVVEVNFGERTLIPRAIASLANRRGTVKEVSYSYDIYDSKDLINTINDDLVAIPELPDNPEFEFSSDLSHYPNYVAYRNLEPNHLYEMIVENVQEKETQTLYFVKRKHVYEIFFPHVHYPLFKKPYITGSGFTQFITEDYLEKVGNVFTNTPLFFQKPFYKRLYNHIDTALFGPKSLRNFERNLKHITESLKKGE